MKKFLIAVGASLIALTSYSQIAKDFMINPHVDLIKSDYDGFFEKFQAGAEVNYFLSRKFTVTGGIEFWSRNEEVSFVMGARWHPMREAFVRLRGLVGANDIAVGGGWAKPLSEDWRFEAMADYYFSGDLSIRAGFAYIIRRNHEK